MNLLPILWVTDPWSTLDYPLDTTLRLAEEALRLGLGCFWASSKDLLLIDSQIYVYAKRIIHIGDLRNEDDFSFDTATLKMLCDFSSIQYRVDPPVDLEYAQPLQLLALAEKMYGIRVEARPESLLIYTEKTLACLIPGAMPFSIVAGDVKSALAFIKNDPYVILKPLNSCQSRGVKLIANQNDKITYRNRVIQQGLKKRKNLIMIQRFLSRVSEGEKRVFFLDGQVLASCLRIPVKGSYINNNKSELQRTDLTKKEIDLVQRVGEKLLALGIRFAAVDLIEGYITDLNITSPGLLIQMEKLSGINLAKKIINAISNPL